MRQTGYFVAGYPSSIDDSEQPFALWVPRTYSGRKKYPIIVALHGSDADHRMIPEACFRLHERPFREEVMLLSPLGRGDLGYRWHAEADVWDALNWVKAHYSINARQQYLTGLSMGGFATWRLATEYPEQWAAIVPICGGGEVSAVKALAQVPVWCVHGDKDDAVSVSHSRKLVNELQRLGYPHRYDELKGWGHNSWEWLYDPERTEDSLVDWLLQFRRAKAPEPVLKPRRQGVFKDIFSERVIISYPAQTPIPAEIELLRAEAEQLARFSFGDYVMRSGRLLVKRDDELTETELKSANLIMIGRTDNHRWLKQMERRLLTRHWQGQLRVNGETYLGKGLVAATFQPSPWNAEKLLGVITYQQFRSLRGIMERLFAFHVTLKEVNLYDTAQRWFIRQEARR